MVSKIQEIVTAIGLRALMVVDVALIVFSFGLTTLMVANCCNWTTITHFFASKVSLRSCALFAIAVLICHVIFSLCNLYRSKRMSTKAADAVDVLRAMALSTACLWGEGRLFSVSGMSPYFLLVFWGIGSAVVITARILLRFILGGIRSRGRNLHHVLVLGSNARAIDFARRTEAIPKCGYRLLGFVDDEWPGLEKFKEAGLQITCNYAGLAEYLRKNVVDEIAIFLPLCSFYERAAEMARLAKQHGILVRFDTDIFDLKFAHARTEANDGTSQIVTGSSGIEAWQLLLKRVLDIA